MASKRKIKRHKHGFTIGINRETGTPVKMFIPCSNGRHAISDVIIKSDAQKGDAGCSGSCGIAESILRLGRDGKLPHPAYYAEVVQLYVYIVDKRNPKTNMPTHCVRYRHNRGDWVSSFDRAGGKRSLIGSWKEDYPLQLMPPYERGSQAGPNHAPNNPCPAVNGNGSRSSHRYMNKPRLRGAMRRAIEAGLAFRAS